MKAGELRLLIQKVKRYSGVLKNVTAGGFELETEVKAKIKGKGKSIEIKEVSFNYDQVKSAREIVTFK